MKLHVDCCVFCILDTGSQSEDVDDDDVSVVLIKDAKKLLKSGEKLPPNSELSLKVVEVEGISGENKFGNQLGW